MSLLVLMLLLTAPLLVNGNEIEELHARVADIKDKIYMLKDNIGAVLKNNAFLEPENILDSEEVNIYFTGKVNYFKIDFDFLNDAQRNLNTLQAFIDIIKEIPKIESSVHNVEEIFEEIERNKVEIKLAENLQVKVKNSLQTMDKYIRLMQSGLKNTIEAIDDKSTKARSRIQDIEDILTSKARGIGVRIN